MSQLAFIADPIESMKAQKDTSFALMRAALELGHSVYHIPNAALELLGSQAWAVARRLRLVAHDKIEGGDFERLPLQQFQQIWLRSDPPFDSQYLYNTQILDFLDPQQSLVINRPSALRDFNEKIAAHHYPQFHPPTLVSCQRDSLLAFASEHEEVVIKPLDGFAGRGIQFTHRQDPQQHKLLQAATDNFCQAIVLQKAVPEAALGDTRVLLWCGQVLGGILRRNEGSRIHNLDAGGIALPTQLSARQQQIAEYLAQDLYPKGIYFCGIDFLGDYLTEINITSPTGLQQLEQFSGLRWSETIMSQQIHV